MAYTQNLNDVKELLKPGILLPTMLAFTCSLLWLIHFFRILTDKMVVVGFLIVVLVLTAGIMSLSIVLNTKWEMRGQKKWPQTNAEITVSDCTISTLTTRTGSSNNNNGLTTQKVYTPQVEYRYTVEGKTFTANFISGPLTKGYDTRDAAETVLQAYPVGKQIPVYYSPRNPSIAVLERKGASLFSLPFLVGILFTLLSFCLGWILTVYAYNDCKPVTASDVFDIPLKMSEEVRPIVERAVLFVNDHPRLKSMLLSFSHKGFEVYKSGEPKLHSPTLSKKKLEKQVALFKDVHADNEKNYLSSVIPAYRQAHYYSSAIKASVRLMELTNGDIGENWEAVHEYALILAESGRVIDAQALLTAFSDRWTDAVEKNEIPLKDLRSSLENIQQGKQVE